MVVTIRQLDHELDAAEERRRRVEHEPVLAGVEPGCELRDAAVVIGSVLADARITLQKLDTNLLGGAAGAGVENVRRDGYGHGDERTEATIFVGRYQARSAPSMTTDAPVR